jgi:transcriptional regulator with XRE-family HTH domain
MIREDRFYKALGAAIRAQREQLGLTQGDLSKQLHLSRTSITNIERGRQRLLIDQFCLVAEVLHIERDALLENALRKDAQTTIPDEVADFVESVTEKVARS